MKTRMFVSLLFCALTVHLFAAHPAEDFKTSAGTLAITPIMHAALMIEAGGQVIQVDPAMGNYDTLPKADIILVTDIHGDHMVPANIDKLKKSGTVIIAPEAVAKTVTTATVMHNGDKKTIGAWTIEAVPMYNMKPDDKGTIYHEKGRGNGYIVTYGGLRVYIAGDTEGTPEMRGLKNIDVAFVPMNLPYTMSPQDAADAVKAFHPKVVYPYHYKGSDLKVFETALQGSGIDVRIRDWYEQ
jgi:L-ascorbate metabolism protein UlaG (beta-lactamase superfamily)